MENASVPSLNFEKPALKISFRAVAHKRYSERKLTYVYIFVKISTFLEECSGLNVLKLNSVELQL